MNFDMLNGYIDPNVKTITDTIERKDTETFWHVIVRYAFLFAPFFLLWLVTAILCTVSSHRRGGRRGGETFG